MPHSAEKTLEQIVSLLKTGHHRLHLRRRLTLTLAGFSMVAAGLLLLLILENSFYLSAISKTVLIAATTLSSVFSVFLLQKKLILPGFRSFYETFFNQQEASATLAAVDLYQDPFQKQSAFYTAALKSNLSGSDIRVIEKKLNENLRQSVIHSFYRRLTLLFPLSLFSLLLLTVLNPEAAIRSLQPWNSFTPPNPYSFTVVPADTTVEQGTALSFTTLFSGPSRPERVYFQFKTEIEENYRERVMIRQGDESFSLPEINLTSDITYRIRMDQFSSETYRVEVQQLPAFESLTALISYPGYTDLRDEQLEYPISTLSLYPGSELTFKGISNKSLESARIQFGDQLTEMERDPGQASHYSITLHPVQNDTLRFSLRDAAGLENRNPFRTLIQLREDQYPQITIREPEDTVTDENPQQLALIYQVRDDFGLTRAQLQYELKRAFVETPIRGTFPLNRPVNGRITEFTMDLKFLELRPRDQLEITIRVWDNDLVSGPKFSDSRPILLRVPSLAESFDEIDSMERDLQSELDQISETFSQMEEEYQQFLERMIRNPDGGFEEEQILENVRERQEQISESVRDLNERFEELRNHLENSSNVSDETRRAYDELRQLMEELDDPALQEAILALQEALQSMSQQDLERAMEDLSFNENLYRERLQRTAELFRQLKMNSDLNRLAAQYEEMASRLEEARDEPLSLRNELMGMEEDFGSLEEQLQQLDSNPPRRAEERLRRMRLEAERELAEIRQDADTLSEEAATEAETGEAPPSGQLNQQREELQERLTREADRFRSALQQISGQQIQVNILALRQALTTLLDISDLQEYVTLTANETRTRSQGFADLARIQNNLRSQFTRVADTLFQVSAELPGVPNQINRKKSEVEQTLTRSLDQMVERNQRGATVASRESLGGINDLASMIASLIEQIQNQQNGGLGSGMTMQQMIEQLQNMSGDQQMLNQQLQDLINDAQGERLTREQSERLDQLARQQNEIRRQLQELQQTGGLRQGDRTLSDLQRAIEEMEDAINEMRGGVTDPLMNSRQQNILSRMLSAQESLQQRGEEEEREGTSPAEYERILPPDMTLEQLQQEIRLRLQDPDYTRFSPEYQRLIERYFQRLRELEDSILQ